MTTTETTGETITETETDPEATTASEPDAASSSRWRRRAGTVGLVVAVAMVSSLTTTWASHQFPDVPNSNPHHDNIAWLANTGITEGFSDGTFKPTQAVSRQSMATFLRRYNARIVMVSKNGTTTGLSDSVQDGAACPSGRRAIGGGGIMSGADMFLTNSYPSADTWFVRWEQQNAGSLGSRSYTVYALCAPPL